MKYRTLGKTGAEVSVLGFGCMRLPAHRTSEGKETVDEPEAIRMIRDGIDGGVNYIDTAYPYHDGESERIVGRALEDGYREKVFLATKSPVWLLNSPKDFDRILEEQLLKLRTDHVDFYLLHALNEDVWENKVLKFNLLEKLLQARRSGKIRYHGFSFHDNAEVFLRILNGWDQWDFCQIQMNYIDIDNQAALTGMEAAAQKGLGVIIMEPLLGGRLANPTPNVAASLDPGRTPVEWALDFLWNRSEVGLVLSGMSNRKQLCENLVYADRSRPGMLSEAELAMLSNARTVFNTMALVSCTACGYCMPCPFGLSIPELFSVYNRTPVETKKQVREKYARLSVKADACQKCGKCEKACPQHIPIREVMSAIGQAFV